MKRIGLALAFIVALTGAAFAQGGMQPGPGTPASAGGGGGVAFDAAASAQRSGGAGSLSWTHTPVGTPTGVAVGLTNFNSNCTISTVTYGGTSMGAAAQSAVFGSGNQNDVRLYVLAAPSSGAQTVSINFSSGSSCFVAGGSITVTGGNTTTAARASNKAAGTSTTPAVSVTSVSGDLVIDIAATADNNITLTGAGGGQTIQVANKAGGGNRLSMSTITATGATTNLSWTIASSNAWANQAASFQP